MRLLFSTLALCIVFSAHPQDRPVFEQKPFRDTNGNLFWPLSLPVYIQLSTSANPADGVALTEGQETTHPMKWDGHGKHYIKHDDSHAGGASTVSFPVNVDGIAPVSSLELANAPRHGGDKVYFGKGLTVFVTAKDEMSGLESIYLSVNQAAYARVTAPVALTAEKEYAVQYFAVDKVGNAGQPQSASFTVDLTPPASTYEVSGSHLDSKILSPRAFITIDAQDAASGVKKTEYYFDDQKPLPYTKKIALTGLEDGEHTLTYYSHDHVGNVESSHQFTFYLDSKGPEVTSSFDNNFALSEGRYYASKGTMVTLSATDNKSGVEQLFYSVNGAAEQPYTGPFSLPARQGTYSIRYRAIDALGNIGATSTNKQISALYIDDTPPVVTHSIGTPKILTRDTLFVTAKALITLKGYDAESGGAIVDYTLDQGDEVTFEEPFTIATEGKHSIAYSGTDLVNNSAVKTFLVVVDNSAPEIFMHTSLEKIGTQKMVDKEEEIPIYASGTSFYLAATDKSVGTKAIYYKLDNQAEVLYTKPVKLAVKGAHVLTIRAEDFLGNERILDPIGFAVQ